MSEIYHGRFFRDYAGLSRPAIDVDLGDESANYSRRRSGMR